MRLKARPIATLTIDARSARDEGAGAGRSLARPRFHLSRGAPRPTPRPASRRRSERPARLTGRGAGRHHVIDQRQVIRQRAGAAERATRMLRRRCGRGQSALCWCVGRPDQRLCHPRYIERFAESQRASSAAWLKPALAQSVRSGRHRYQQRRWCPLSA